MSGRPLADVVSAAVLSAMHYDIPISLVSKVLLNRFVRTVGVTNKHLEAFVDDRVDADLLHRLRVAARFSGK